MEHRLLCYTQLPIQSYAALYSGSDRYAGTCTTVTFSLPPPAHAPQVAPAHSPQHAPAVPAAHQGQKQDMQGKQQHTILTEKGTEGEWVGDDDHPGKRRFA